MLTPRVFAVPSPTGDVDRRWHSRGLPGAHSGLRGRRALLDQTRRVRTGRTVAWPVRARMLERPHGPQEPRYV